MIEHKGIDRPRPEVANRVVSWHNRHPLACKIKPAQVRHVGLIVLPFAAAAGSALEPPPGLAEAVPEPAPGQGAVDGEVPVEIILPSVVDAVPDEGVDVDLDSAADADGTPGPADVDPADAASLSATGEALAGQAQVPTTIAEMRADEDLARQHRPPPVAKPLPWWRRFGRRAAPTGSPALFSETLIPALGAKGLAELARRHGMPQRPPGDQWPERVAQVDRDLQDAADEAGLFGRSDRVLLTATIDDGTRRLRVVIGGGLRPAIVGPRLWDRQRLGMAGALLLGSVMASSWSLGYRLGASDAPTGAAAQVATAASGAMASAASGPASGPSHALPSAHAVVASAPASGAEPQDTVLAAAAPASTPAPAAAASAVSPSTALARQTADDSAHADDAPPARPPKSPAAEPAPAPTATAAVATAGSHRDTPASPASGNLVGPAAGAIGAVAHKSIVPNLRPQLATSVQAVSHSQFALVSAPLRSRTEADAMLKRLRSETSRLHHPVAVETSALSSPQGWRVSWWPFAGRKQAENARAMLADRHLDMDIVDF